jgi:hypothetical protein
MSTVQGGQGNIVTNGLVLNLDAANPRSYPQPYDGTTWTDLSGLGNNGILVSGSVFSTSGSGCMAFDGVNDYIDCGNSSSLNITNQITLSAWVNGIYAPSGEYSVLDKGGILGYHFAIYASKIIFQPQSAYRSGNTTLLSNVWYNIAITYNKTNVYFYLNGLPDGIQAITGGLNAPSDPVWISRYANAQPLPFNGKINLPMMYNRMLSSQEVLQNFNATRARFGI